MKFFTILSIIGLFYCNGLYAQVNENNPSIDSISSKNSIQNLFDGHIGWAQEKNIYAGIQVSFFRLDWGFNIFGSSLYSYTLSGDFLWVFKERRDSSEQPWIERKLWLPLLSQSLVSLNYTVQYTIDEIKTHYITINIGKRWLPKPMEYMILGGIGLQFNNIKKLGFFFGFDFSVGYIFFNSF